MDRARVWGVGVFAAAFVALGVAGCGGSYTKKDYVGAADGICLRTLHELRSIDTQGATSTQLLARYLRKALPVIKSQEHQLRKLKLPAGKPRQRAELRRFLMAVSQQTAEFAALSTVTQSGNTTRITSVLTSLQSIPVTATAEKYGFKDCGQSAATYRTPVTTQ